MKRILSVLVCIAAASNLATAKTPQTVQPTLRRMTDAAVQRPQTPVGVQRPVTQTSVVRPATQAQVMQPQTTVQVVHPQTTAVVLHPKTTVEVVHPQTTVAVFHPQTATLEQRQVSAHNSVQAGGKKAAVPSAKAATSMSGFTPKQAKNFDSQKAAPIGGGDNKLGNDTDQAAKDAAAKASLLGAQNNQNMDVDLKQNKLGGVDKLITDRAKWKEKQK